MVPAPADAAPKKSKQTSLVNDDKGAVTAWCNGMRNARRDDENLSLLDADDMALDIEVHLPLQNQQGLGKLMRLVWIGAIVHPKHFDIGTRCLANDHGAPGL